MRYHHFFLRDIDHEMVDDQERMKEGRSRERIWRGKFHFPRDLLAYFRATFFTSVPRREPWFKPNWRVPHRTTSYSRLGLLFTRHC